MIHLTDIAEIVGATGGWRILLIAALVSAISGFIRGFTGFGSALFFIPAVAAIYDPKVAAATLVLIDIAGTIGQTIGERRNCQWREVRFLTGAALVGALAGTVALLYAQPFLLRYFASAIVLLVLFALAAITAGWRYRERPSALITMAVGLLSGFLGGAIAMEGPPAVLFWLGGANSTAVTRANVMMFIVLTEFVVLCFYIVFGLITVSTIVLAIVLLPFFWISVWLGTLQFKTATDLKYRRIAGAVIALSAIGSLFFHNVAG